ncbi:hypothetical protein B0J11DRAFT_526802 [Dendryphion nanum]|uniref:Zn(2)-C6 fungal-type domain-containing protein n=1 Tax=Dendryphion nanum TaxID=256645 RepID=A0A9P9DXL6_9PLEO|nr:hypothetical protein B0J11DRAFT_526802 [Dendryphion nanum]
MPKARLTCTRCSQRRQRCDRETPCSRCIKNNEPHLCTTEWREGYNPNVHRKYPRKSTPPGSQHGPSQLSPAISAHDSTLPQQDGIVWPNTPTSFQDMPTHFRSQGQQTYSNVRIGNPQEPTPSSNNLDFITFGRSDYSDISIGSLLASKDAFLKSKMVRDNQGHFSATKQVDGDGHSGGFSSHARAVEVFNLQSMLPAKESMLKMVDYHELYMAYWAGGIYHGPTFRKALLSNYGESQELDLQTIDWRWTALLFSILSASVIGSPEVTSTSWGYSVDDKRRLAKQWANATIACLHLGEYASNYHNYSIQAVINIHASEHLIGASKEWAVYQSAAITIARGLALHRIPSHPEDGKTNLNAEQKDALIQREIGRRIWTALSAQDWLCSTSQGMYSIQKRHCTTTRPGNYDENTFEPIIDGSPTPTQIGNYVYDVAYLLISYHDEMLDSPDITTKYQVVLKYDSKMRRLVDEIPACLSPRTPYNPAWPRWAGWARRLHQASWAHKIIMIHQAFLHKSFKSPQYTYSRWACATAAKVIIEQMSREREPDEPQWWVEQAFIVTSGICLALDIFHRSETDVEIRDYLTWIEKTIKLLEQWPNSSIATHGVRLLTSLVHEFNKKINSASKSSHQNSLGSAAGLSFPENIAPASLARAAGEAEAAEEAASVSDPQPPEGWPVAGIDVEMFGFEDIMDNLPVEAGLDNNMFFESMLSLANSQFF